MSKRKYGKDVSKIVYGSEYQDRTIFPATSHEKEDYREIPVRIVRESFYRKLIKAYEVLIENGLIPS
jgi:hypothetical protein